MDPILSVHKRDNILKLLTDQQREFVLHKAKRGKKTVFANIMAKDKGVAAFSENLTDEQLENLLDDWILEDVLDGGEDWRLKELYCECGRKLRHQYIIRHLKTNEIRKFGIVHFEEHSGLPTDIVKEVIKGFQNIDYELDELLMKISSAWQLPFSIPQDLHFPSDIQQHLDLQLPLLDRQIQRLQNVIRDHEEKLYFERTIISHSSPQVKKEINNNYEHHFELELFDYNHTSFEEVSELSHIQMVAVLGYLREGITSVRLMCELLIKENKTPNNRYSTGKPKIYPFVCLFLETLVNSGEISFAKNNITDLIVSG